MISLTGEYALRALIYMAQNSERWPIAGREIAEGAGVPAKYLSTILSELARQEILDSTRGKSGGFRMVRSPAKTFLYEVLAPFESYHRRRCPFGNDRCSDHDPCLAHENWKMVNSALQDFLRQTSIQDIAFSKAASGKIRSGGRAPTATGARGGRKK